MEKLLYALLISLASVTAFSGLRQATAVWDERQLIVAATESHEEAPLTLPQRLKTAWQLDRSSSYTPMAPTVYHLARAIAPTRYSALQVSHVLNFTLHVMNAILILLILSLVLQSSGSAFWGALIFALHPIQVEALASPAALPTLLGAWFGLIALWQFFIAQTQDVRREPSPTPLRLATIAFIASVLATPLAAVTPLLGLILFQVMGRPQRGSPLSAKSSPLPLLLWLLLAIGPVFWAIRAQETQALADQIPFWGRFFIGGDALSFYLAKIFVPLKLGPDYGRSPAYVLSHWWGYLTFLGPLVLLAILGFFRDLRDYYFAALGLFILALTPFLGLVLFPAQASSTVADSFAYLALLGPALALAATFLEVKNAWLPTLSVLAVAALGLLSFQQTSYWQNNNSLWSYAVTVNPQSPKVHTALAASALAKGDWSAAKDHYEQVLAVNQIDPRIYFQLGTIESEHGDPMKAIPLYEKALALNPRLVEAHGRLGLDYYQHHNYAQALPHFQAALALAPENPLYLRYLGVIAVDQQRYAEGLPYLQKYLSLSTTDSVAEKAKLHALIGVAMRHTKQLAGAQKHLEQALALDPKQPDAHRLLADIYFEQKRWQDALPHYEVVLATETKDPELYRRLGLIRLQAKQYAKAVLAFDEALKLKADWPEVLSGLGAAYYYQRRFPEASATLHRSLAFNPQQAEPHYILGEIARWLGPPSTAAMEFGEALKIDPEHLEARYRLGNWLLKKRRFDEAAKQFKTALKQAPADARLISQLQKAERHESDQTDVESVSR